MILTGLGIEDPDSSYFYFFGFLYVNPDELVKDT